MTIESLANTLSFLGIEGQYFEITGGNDSLIFTSNVAGPITIKLTDGTYSGSELATALQTAMNDDDTLTGGTITFAVSYSTTTNKFTIDAGVAKTIAYTHLGSSAGYTIGFSANAAAARTITSDMPAGDSSTLVQSLLTETEKFISTLCHRTFESTSYSLERYSGKGQEIINLRNYPVTAVDRVCVGTRDAINIKNTSSGTYASASVTSTGLRLVKDGVADTSITFAVSTTIASVISAINALGNGWYASVTSSDYNSFKSTDLILQYATGTINNEEVYLSIVDKAENAIGVDLDRGQIRLYGGFYPGWWNVFVDYTAGYTTENMPEDLKLAVKITVQYLYEKVRNSVFGIDFYNIGASGATGLRTIFEKSVLPKEAEYIINHYRRRLVSL